MVPTGLDGSGKLHGQDQHIDPIFVKLSVYFGRIHFCLFLSLFLTSKKKLPTFELADVVIVEHSTTVNYATGLTTVYKEYRYYKLNINDLSMDIFV